MKLLRALAVLALTSVNTHAAKPVNTQGWCQVGNGDFTFISQMSPSATAVWADRLNQFLHAMNGRLRVDGRILGPFTIVLFRNIDDFWQSAPVLSGGAPLNSLAAFSREAGWGSLAASCELGSTEGTRRMIFQTGVSWLMSGDHRPRPPTLQKGIGAAYSTYVIENNEEVFGRPIYGASSHIVGIENHPMASNERFLPIEELLAVRDINTVADRHDTLMFSLESWGFAHFLLFSKDMVRRHAMEHLLDAFAHTSDPHDALKIAFGEDARIINSLFLDYMRGGNFYEVTCPLEPAPPLRSPAPAPQALVASVLARLEASVHNLDVARAYAEQAVRLAPNDSSSYDALAMVDFFAKRFPETAADCREAIRLETRDGWTWLEASELLGRSGAEGSTLPTLLPITSEKGREAINLCEKAILCRRGLTVAFDRIAALIPIADHVTEDDGKFLALGQTLFPNDGWIEIGRAQWARRVHEPALALKLLDDVLARSAALSSGSVEKARMLRAQWAAGPG